MKKIKKTYRLHDGCIAQISAIRHYYEGQGFGYSDANIIEKAVSAYMDEVSRGQRLIQYVKKGVE